jgi:hypothetical protein
LQRLTAPYLKRDGFFHEVNWVAALRYLKNGLVKSMLENKSFMARSAYIELGVGAFVDFETSTIYKSFSNLCGAAGNKRSAGFLDNDFRRNYGISVLPELETGVEHKPEDLLIILFGINLRFESPIMNLKVRRINVNHFIEVSVVGYLSNFNFNYKHRGTGLSRQILISLNSGWKRVLVISGESLGDDNSKWASATKINFNYIFRNISSMSVNEISLNAISENNETYRLAKFNFGACESDFSAPAALTFFFLHHMEGFGKASDNQLKGKYALLLPTKFYLEKAGSYISNAFNQFSTANLYFKFSLFNTREE